MNELEQKDALQEVLANDEPAVSAAAETRDDAVAGTPETTGNYHAMTREQLLEALKGVIASGDMEAHREVAAIKQAYYSLLNRDAVARLQAFVEGGNSPESYSSEPEPTEQEMKALFADFREKRAAFLEREEETKRENLQQKNAVIAELRGFVEDIDNINLHYTRFQELQQEFKGIGDVPPGQDNEVWKNFQAVVEQFYDRLKMNKELRDLDFKKNLEVKQSFVAKAHELTELEDPIEAFRRLQDLHAQWRATGPVAKEIRDEIWNEFKELSTVVNKRHQDFFQARKDEESANEAKKTEICVKAESIDVESLRTFGDWDAKTKEIVALQKEYKEAGFASRKANNELYQRFRTACDAFFTAKAGHFKKAKDEHRLNLAKKEELCAKAEALVEKALEKNALDQLKSLQEAWKSAGVVRRKQGEEVWKRFCDAVDAFYAARKSHFGAKRNEENDNLKAKQEIIASLKEISEESDRREVIGRIRELQDKWQQTGHVPFRHKDAVSEEYRAELKRLFSAFDSRESGQRMRRFENEVKKMEGDSKGIGRERERLQRALESRQAEIKTIENNLGFFKFKSAEGNPMLRDFERKIEKLKEDIAEINGKIQLLDSQK